MKSYNKIYDFKKSHKDISSVRNTKVKKVLKFDNNNDIEMGKSN